MSFDATITSDLQLLLNSVTAASPIETASTIAVQELRQAGLALISKVDANINNSGVILDQGDLTGYPGDMVNGLNFLDQANDDQVKLVDIRGLVGRAIFNLFQVNL